MSANTSEGFLPATLICLISGKSSSIVLIFFIINILLILPSSSLVLLLGLRQRRSASAAPCSHSDVLTYHIVVVELVGVAGYVLCCVAICAGDFYMMWVGFFLWCFAWLGETIFHLLTCVDRYLAVAHPVAYLGMRGERGIRIRDLSIGGAWLLSIAGISTLHVWQVFIYLGFILAFFSIIFMSFSSFSILRILKRPGPGVEPGGRVDRIKQRAFFTIMAILGIQFIRCFFNLLWLIINLGGNYACLVIICGIWFNVPCSMMMPLLYLYRARRSACCMNGRTNMTLNQR